MATTSSVGNLDSYFTNLISDLMTIERQSLTRLTDQKDTVTLQRAAYVDLKSKLDSLQSVTRSLIKSSPFYSFSLDRTTTVTQSNSDKTVLTASANSKATVGSYNVSVSQLATAQQRVSAVQTSSDLALNKTGTFYIGGTGTASASATTNATIESVSTGEVATGLTELGTGTASEAGTAYTVETQMFDGVLKFRLKDADGKAMSIAVAGASDNSLTSDWQNVTAGEYDTKRGLKITFGAAAEATTTSIDYTARGTSVTIEASDSLISIANKINAASQSEGREITASVLGNQLMLSAVNTGTKHQMIYSDNAGLGISDTDLTAAKDSIFTVDTLSFTRSGTTNLTDVIYGVTLNLNSDAEGNSAKVTVNSSTNTAKEAINSFISKFNEVQSYLEAKTAVEKVEDTYIRGTLANDTVFSELRANMFNLLISPVTTSGYTGKYQSLYEIGISIDSSLQVSITDSSKLEQALKNNFSDVEKLLEDVMGRVNDTLGRFTGSSGYLQSAVHNYDNQLKDISSDIASKNTYLAAREAYLTSQYAEMQTVLMTMSYEQQAWKSLYNASS